MSPFFRFPHTPHLAWLGPRPPRDDKVLGTQEVAELLARELVVEEKVDGANLGFSTSEDGDLRCQNRGSTLTPESAHPQFRPLWPWLAPRREALVDALWPDRLLFGEWCRAVHSVPYDALPDWFLGFDVYDRSAGRFLDTRQRDALLQRAGLHPVPSLGRGRFDLHALLSLLGRSRLGQAPMEGLVVRSEQDGWLTARAKLVRAEFIQAIDTHWSRGAIVQNRLIGSLAGGTAPWP